MTPLELAGFIPAGVSAAGALCAVWRGGRLAGRRVAVWRRRRTERAEFGNLVELVRSLPPGTVLQLRAPDGAVLTVWRQAQQAPGAGMEEFRLW